MHNISKTASFELGLRVSYKSVLGAYLACEDGVPGGAALLEV